MKRWVHGFGIIITLLLLLGSQAQAFDRWDVGVLRQYAVANYEAEPVVWDATQDTRGVMYFATFNGVYEFDSINWRLIKIPGDGGASSLITDDTGRVFVGGYGELGYLAPNSDGKTVYVSLKDQVQVDDWEILGPLLESLKRPDGELLFLFEQLLLRYKDGVFTKLETEGYLYKVTPVGDTLYVLDSDYGLMRIVDGALQNVPEGNFFLAHAMLPYPGGRLLLVTQDKGLLLYDPALDSPANEGTPQREAFTFLEHANHEVFENHLVTARTEVAPGVFLLAVDRVGIVRLDFNEETVTVLEQMSIGEQNVFSVFQDLKDNTWLASSDGVYAFIPLEEPPTVPPDVEMFVSARPPLVREDPEFTPLIRQVESIQDEVSLFDGNFFEELGGIAVRNESPLTTRILPYEQNAVRFTFTSNDYTYPSDVMYQTYLEGMEDDWSKWSIRPFREYTNLTWKEYVFHVKAMRKDGARSEPVSFTFTVEPPWYETWWFYSAQIGFLMVLLLISGILRGMGYSENISDYIVAVVVMVMFAFLDATTEPYVDDLAEDSFYFKVLLLVAVGLTVEPLQNLAKNLLGNIHIKGFQQVRPEDIDDLTKLFDHDFFLRRLDDFVVRSQKTKGALSVVVVDPDNFHLINDKYGFECGDEVIRTFAEMIKRHARKADVPARYTGEKVIIALPNLGLEAAKNYAQQVQRLINEHEFVWEDKMFRVTVSTGVGSYPDIGEENLSVEGLLAAAEKDAGSQKIEIDQLTQLATRDTFDRLFDELAEDAKKKQNSLAVVLVDPDHFKNINNAYGFEGGDYVIQELAKIVKKYTRKTDIPARYFGEKIIVVLRNLDTAGAMDFANQIHRDIQDYDFIWRGERFSVPVTLGVASYPEVLKDNLTRKGLVMAAENAADQAQEKGGNQVGAAMDNFTDDLTQLPNRGYFMRSLGDLVLKAEQTENALSVVVVDPDNFHLINDKYGFECGDEVIRTFAQAVQEQARKTDLPARYHGDKVIVALPHLDKQAARSYAKKVQKLINEHEFHWEDKAFHVSVCVGVGAYPDPDDEDAELSVDALLEAAERDAEGQKIELDELTHLATRDSFARNAEELVRWARKKQSPLSLLLVDPDHFRTVNNTYGFEGGDYVIKQLAEIVRQNCRKTDIPSRYFGEKLIVAMKNMDSIAAQDVAQKIHQDIQDFDFNWKGQHFKVEVTLGVASYPEVLQDNLTRKALILAAEYAVDLVQESGGNQVGVAPADYTVEEPV